MTRAALILLSIGTALFVGLLAWQGFGSVASALAAAGWGLVLVAAFHLVPLVLLSPVTVFLLAIASEALILLVSVSATMWAARQGRHIGRRSSHLGR